MATEKIPVPYAPDDAKESLDAVLNVIRSRGRAKQRLLRHTFEDDDDGPKVVLVFKDC